VAGHDVAREPGRVRRLIALAGQSATVDEDLTGRENLVFLGRLAGLRRAAARARAAQLLTAFGLADAAARLARQYSGGMRRRLDLAASLVGSPRVIFLDEPTTGLDLPSRQAMWEVVAGLAADGVTIFLTTQYLEEADRLADRIAVLDGGRLVAEGTAAELKERVASRRLDLRLASQAAFDQVRGQLNGTAVHADLATLTVGVATDGAATSVRAALDSIDPGRRLIADFAVTGASLDDVFLALTGGNR
jgi:ABC-2 type transport system ATP-binding protein